MKNAKPSDICNEIKDKHQSGSYFYYLGYKVWLSEVNIYHIHTPPLKKKKKNLWFASKDEKAQRLNVTDSLMLSKTVENNATFKTEASVKLGIGIGPIQPVP